MTVVEQHRQEKADAAFLPGSERILQVSGFGIGEHEATGLLLQVGVVLTKETFSGLKLATPTHEVGFAIGGNLIPVGLSMARELGKRIVEFCDEAEALNKGPTK